MAGGIEGKEDSEEQDHKCAGQKARRSAKQGLGVAEKPALIGKQPLRKISAPFRTEQVIALLIAIACLIGFVGLIRREGPASPALATG